MDKNKKLDELRNKLSKLEVILNGGKGSGNFGHSGRPGKIGGSGKGDSGDGKSKPTKEASSEKEFDSSKSELYSKVLSEFSEKIENLDLNSAYRKMNTGWGEDGDLSLSQHLEQIYKEESEEILQGAMSLREAIAESVAWGDDISNYKIATEEQLEKNKKAFDVFNEVMDKAKEMVFSKAENTIEAGYYRDKNSGEVFEVVKGLVNTGSEDNPFFKQACYPITETKSRDFLEYADSFDFEKIDGKNLSDFVSEGSTLNGISKTDEQTIRFYTHMTPHNSELRNGKPIEEIKYASNLKGIIDRTNGSSGEYWRGLGGDGAKEALSLKVGDTYMDKGFMSATSSFSVASEKFGNSKVLLKINSKGGMGKSIDVSSYSEFPEEMETIFNAGTSGRVKSISDKNGYKVIEIEV